VVSISKIGDPKKIGMDYPKAEENSHTLELMKPNNRSMNEGKLAGVVEPVMTQRLGSIVTL
jgi:hypothetical protein